MALSDDVQTKLRNHRRDLERKVGQLRIALELMREIISVHGEFPNKLTDRAALEAWEETRARLVGGGTDVSTFATTDLELPDLGEHG